MANKHILYVLKRAKTKLRNAIISNSDDELVKTLIEIVLNTLQGNHRLTNKHLNLLKRYKNVLRKISCSKRTIKATRKVLIQKGGFLPILISSLLAGVFGKLLENEKLTE